MELTESQIYGVIAVLILVMLIVSVIWFQHQADQEAVVMNVEPIEMAGRLLSSGVHMATPGFVDDGARTIAHNQAYVVYGEIPQGQHYWSLTGYLYDRDGVKYRASLGDSVSHGGTGALSPGDGIAVVVASNPKMFDLVTIDLRKLWTSTHYRHPITILPQYIPAELYSTTARYTIVAHTELNRPLPGSFEGLFYTASNLMRSTPTIASYTQRNNYPREQDTVSPAVWSTATSNAAAGAAGKRRQIIREVPVAAPDYDAGIEYIRAGQDAHYDNRDITVFTSDAVSLTAGEKLVLVAADHVASGRCHHSTVEVVDATGRILHHYITGATIHHHRNQHGNLRTSVIEVPETTGHVRVIERCFVERLSEVGPDPNSILRVKAYVTVNSSSGQQTLKPSS